MLVPGRLQRSYRQGPRHLVPIAAFVFAGFEHSVANMTYIPLGMFLGADVSVGDMFLKNLLPVTLGNMIGGALFVPVIYYICYGRKKK